MDFVIIQEFMEIINVESEGESDEEVLNIISNSTEKTNYAKLCACTVLCANKSPVPRIKNYVEEVVPRYSDKIFKTHFRMERATFNFILNTIKSSLTRELPGQKMVPPEKQLLLAIWKMATPDSYRSICEKFNVSRSTTLTSVRRVIKALADKAPNFIFWPPINKVEEIWTGFESTSAFPKVIGAIDGTHINIPAPHNHPEAYINRKDHHAIHLQAVCEWNLCFLHCVVGYAGSVHDQRVFRLSEVNDYLGDHNRFPHECHLLGDLAYMLHKNLLTPYRDNGHLTERQRNYNFCHESARVAIERAFGMLKGRFRSLRTVLDMETTDLIPQFIIACCVLRNICILKNDILSDVDVTNNEEHNFNLEQQGTIANRAIQKRDNICAQLIMRNI